MYPLYGIRYWLYRASRGLTNSAVLHRLFGDSSAIVHYLRLIGYRIGRPLVQSGSNFGVEVRHENPYLSGVGSGTMVSDGLSFMNAEYSSTSFRVRRARWATATSSATTSPTRPARRTGDNCLLATKVMVPIDGTVRDDVGLLGSPAFEIPRTVAARPRLRRPARTAASSAGCCAPRTGTTRVTAGLFLLAQLVTLAVVRAVGAVALDLYHEHGFWVVPWPPSRGSCSASLFRSWSSGRSRRSGR